MASFQERVIGALKLQGSTFEEIEHDETATTQAAIVVFAASIARGLGAVLPGGVYFAGFGGIVLSVLQAFVSWAAGAAVLWIIGTRVLPGKNTQADFGQLLRTVGFAQSPALFAIFGIIPFLGPFLVFVAIGWALVATVVAVRQALDYDDTLRAVIVCVIAYVGMLIVMMLLSLIGIGARVF